MSGRLESVAIIGGAGFIGSHFVDRLLSIPHLKHLVVFDNFSSGKQWHYEHNLGDVRLSIVTGDVRNLPTLTSALDGVRTVVHLASNPDIAAAITRPSIDFDQGSLLTHCIAEACRAVGVEQILYASGSGVYGERSNQEVDETFGPLVPVSTYAASKLAGEALLCSYAHMFGIQVVAFRFGNVVGPRQTHGVGFDFIRKLKLDSTRLEVLGDGNQSKPYVFVTDIIDAVMLASTKVDTEFEVFNVATLDNVSVREIADAAIEVSGLSSTNVEIAFTGGNRGWKGDVPIVKMSSRKIREIGWQQTLTSREAIYRSLRDLHSDSRHYSFHW